MIYKVIIMCQATVNDKATYYRLKVKGNNPDDAFNIIDKFIRKIQRLSYSNIIKDEEKPREMIYAVMKQIKNAFKVVEMHQSSDDFESGQCDIQDCRLLRKK